MVRSGVGEFFDVAGEKRLERLAVCGRVDVSAHFLPPFAAWTIEIP